MKIRISVFSIPALVLGALLAAAPLSFAAETGKKTTAKDVSRKVDETGEAIKNYTVAQRDEAVKKAKGALDDADRSIRRTERKLYRERAKMDQAGREKGRETLHALRRERNQLGEWYGGGEQSAPAGPWVGTTACLSRTRVV